MWDLPSQQRQLVVLELLLVCGDIQKTMTYYYCCTCAVLQALTANAQNVPARAA